VKADAPQPWNVSEHLLYHLSFTSELIGLREEAMFKECCGLGLADWRVLSLIASSVQSSSRDITRVSTLSKVMVSRVIARLTDAGLIERVRSETDNRMQYLELTKAGKQVFRQAKARFEEWSESLLEPLNAADIRLLKQTLTRLRTRLGEMEGEDSIDMRVFALGAGAATRRRSGGKD
jgi:DNA-binding MarR family transcriptional regulator